MSPIAGFVRQRRHLFGRQPVFGTKVPATRAYPFKGVPDPNLNWTDPDVDVGSRDVVVAPWRGAPTLPASLTDPALAYNTLPLLLSAFFGGGEAPTPVGSTGQRWAFDPASLTLDEPDLYTYEFGDDVEADWYQFGDGLLDSFEVAGPEGLGPLTASMTWRFGSVASTGSTDSPVNSGSGDDVPTAGLDVDTDAVYVYLKDGAIYINSDPSLVFDPASKISHALHSFSLKPTQEMDEKRWADGTQTFDVEAYGPGKRGIDLDCTWAKTADIVGLGSEADAWLSDRAVKRYVGLEFISTAFADGSTPYSFKFSMPMRYYTRAEGEVGGNTTVALTGHAFYDPAGSGSGDGFGGVFNSEVVCQLTEADLGIIGS